MQNRPSDPILIPGMVEASSEFFLAAIEPFELLDKIFWLISMWTPFRRGFLCGWQVQVRNMDTISS
jgi:hypothetical protein